MRFTRSALLLPGAFVFGLSVAGWQPASAVTGNLTVQLEIIAACEVSPTATLDFGSHGFLDADIDESVDITVKCTDGEGYTIALGDGLYETGGERRMKHDTATEYITYGLFQDAAWQDPWDEVDTKSGTGTGANQTHTIYGLVGVQATPAVGDYEDTVTITVEL